MVEQSTWLCWIKDLFGWMRGQKKVNLKVMTMAMYNGKYSGSFISGVFGWNVSVKYINYENKNNWLLFVVWICDTWADQTRKSFSRLAGFKIFCVLDTIYYVPLVKLVHFVFFFSTWPSLHHLFQENPLNLNFETMTFVVFVWICDYPSACWKTAVKALVKVCVVKYIWRKQRDNYYRLISVDCWPCSLLSPFTSYKFFWKESFGNTHNPMWTN